MLGGKSFSSVWACLYPPIALAFSLRTALQNFNIGLIWLPLAMMVVMGVLCTAVAVVLNNAVADATGIRARVAQWLRSRRDQSHRNDAETPAHAAAPSSDPEVLAEIKRVEQDANGADDIAVKIQQLSKTYGTFKAVDSLTLGLDKDECFGLLGPNGCGKSTTVSMLCGIVAPSSGTATVAGISIGDSSLTSHLGVCPQEDRVVRDLTVEENLLFFARLRGASGKQAHAYAEHAAGIVGLTGAAYRRAAEHLSGGMRRRLSIAVALIGLPSVIILDEPTTGLDPGNRMQIWSIIAGIRDSREHSIILISHLMEEVEALTSRIGIMAAGSLRCLGNQISLKNRFANGYMLNMQVNVSATQQAGVKMTPVDFHAIEVERIEEISRFVRANVSFDATLGAGGVGSSVYPDMAASTTELQPTWTISLQYRLPGNVDLAAVFETMEKEADGQDIGEWALNQNSLEDVFLEVVTPYLK